jgi:tRNA pseudouridine55 synthase
MRNQFIFAIYKPIGISSFDVIRQLRKITNIRKIGHAGTLDPLAEGVLVVGITRNGTRQLNQLLKCNKEYLADIKLGATTETGDREMAETVVEVKSKPTQEEVENALKTFVGETEQKPHRYSAVKIQGQPAYKRVRKGEEVEIEPKQVIIHRLTIEEYNYPLLTVRAKVGSGVYIRSLARDLGEKLTTGAYLTSLLRTRVGEYSVDDAFSLEEFAEKWESGEIGVDQS